MLTCFSKGKLISTNKLLTVVLATLPSIVCSAVEHSQPLCLPYEPETIALSGFVERTLADSFGEDGD